MKFSLKNLRKMKISLNPILYNRVILYFLSLLAILDIIYFMSTNDGRSLLAFILIAILTTFFSKNMIVILVIALSITHVIKYGNSAYEGFEGESEGEVVDAEKSKVVDAEKSEVVDAEKSEEVDEKKERMKENTVKIPSAKKVDKEVEYADLKKEYKDFEGIGKDIMDNVKKIEPLLTKAEAFITKYENYKNKNERK